MFLRWDRVFLSSHDLLSVVDQEAWEEDGHQSAVHGVEDWPRLNEEDDGQDAEEKEDPGGGEEVDAHASEVPFGLEREEGEAQAEEGRDADGHENPVGVVVDCNAGHPQWERDGEDEHSDHVSGEPASDGLAAGDGQVGNKEDDVGDDVDDEAVVRDGGAPFGSIAHLDVVLAVEVFDRRSEAEDGDEGRRHCQLTQ